MELPIQKEAGYGRMSIALVVLIVSLTPYFIICLVALVFGRNQIVKKNYSYHPTVTIFLPTLNEEKYIARKLDNLLQQTYPIDEILIYDCSHDDTTKIIKEYQERHENIRLINQDERIGMARTLNEAFKKAKGDIIVKTDCDSLTKSRNALKELIADFSDEKIGGISGVCVDEGVEGYFRSFMTRLQIAESNIDSTIVGHATSFLAFRRKVVEEVNPESIADDTEEFVLIRKKGYRTIIDSNVCSQEETPQSFANRRIQKDRRAQGVAGVLLRNFSMMFNPKYGFYGLMVFPIDFFLLVVSPFVAIVDIILLGYILFLFNQFYLIPYGVLLSFLLISYFVGKLNWLAALVDLQLSGFMGTLKILMRKSDAKWDRVR